MLECFAPEKGEGEGWELYEKKGVLHLRGESELGLIYGLSFLGKMPPKEALTYMGRHTPRFPVRALAVAQKNHFSEEELQQVLEMGYNTLILETALEDDELTQPYLKVLPLHRSQAKNHPSRHELLKDLLVKELKAAEKQYHKLIFLISNVKGLAELNFESTHAILAFEGEASWEELKAAPPFGTYLMPYLSDQTLTSFRATLSRMTRHPFAGLVIEIPDLPERRSPQEKSLHQIGFGQFLRGGSHL